MTNHTSIIYNISLFSLFLLQVSPSPTQPGSCPESHQTAYPPQTWSLHDSSGSDRRTETEESRCAVSIEPFNTDVHSHAVTNRRQVAHHEEGREGGVKEEGNPLCGWGWDAQAAYAGCVCYRDVTEH